LAELRATPEGLDSGEAQRRLDSYGPNLLAREKGTPAWRRLVRQCDNVLIYVLLACAVGTAALQNWVDTGVILGVVVINALIGFLQEGKAEKALDSIAGLMSLTALVSRNGHRVRIEAADVVPGDIVHIKAGDRVPADLRLIGASALEIEEATLTGESLAAAKSTVPAGLATPLAERNCMAYAGTLVTHGQGTGLAVATGAQTEVGRIGSLLASVERLATPLLARIESFAKWLAIAILILAGASFLAAWLWRGFELEESFMAAVSLAVAAIPEGLPAILTIALAVGVRRMAVRNALIRRLPAVETLGSVTVICSDKTGTLTQNKMKVTDTFAPPEGERALLEAALLCNDATIRQEDGRGLIDGAPTERALLQAAVDAGLDPLILRQCRPRLSETPFDSLVKRMATQHALEEGKGQRIYVKGAPESVLTLCNAIGREEWARLAHEEAAKGRRVLAFACKDVTAAAGIDQALEEGGFHFLGLAAIADPPRPEAALAVSACQRAGIAVCMITGDHAETARAIGREMGISTDSFVLTGPEIDGMDEAALTERMRSARIVARATPEHKLRLVAALKRLGEVVAMTGDGVNDAPALKKADIGVAMGLAGTEAAKEAAMMVLADDNFATIADAVHEGRAVYDNLKKSIAYVLPTNMAQAFVIIAAILANSHLPITPLQILWVNMVTAVTLAMALAFEKAEPGVMLRLPRPPAEPLITLFQLWRLLLVTGLCVAATFGLFLHAHNQGASMDEARTIAVNTLVALEIAYLFNMRFLNAPAWGVRALLGSRPVLISTGVMIVLQMAFTYLPLMQAFFKTAPLGLAHLGQILLAALALFILIELEKAWWKRRGSKN
jgi:calcium-translocating P-type ATPase